MQRFSVLLLTITLALGACAPAVTRAPEKQRVRAEARLRTTARTSSQSSCIDTFVEHRLPFATGVRVREIGTYLSNGAGLAAGDIDNDGDLDLVFASIDGPSKLLLNTGTLHFVVSELNASFTRAVALVDFDGDGWLDLFLSDRVGALHYFANMRGTFDKRTLSGVTSSVYSMAWADLTDDGRLDLVTGSYDTELRKRGVLAAEIAQTGGVWLYQNTPDGLRGQRLAPTADALAIGLLDLNNDDALDIWVGNDFLTRDAVWLKREGRWQPDAPFARMSHSTMSIDWADIDNRGDLALFTTDMNPYDTRPQVWAEWLPMMTKTDQTKSGDPQISANVLQTRRDGRWVDGAPARGIDATGWSWAGRFADFDNDGFQDLYVVNGSIATDLFGHLNGAELVEENRAFRNTGTGRFELAQGWGLASTQSGRGMLPLDIDNDGDLDIVVNNLRGSAMLFENRLCGGAGLTVKLTDTDTVNINAIGARVILHTSAGVMQRDARASGGYLSTDAPLLHFGLPVAARIDKLNVIWPDNAQTTFEAPALAGANLLMEITR